FFLIRPLPALNGQREGQGSVGGYAYRNKEGRMFRVLVSFTFLIGCRFFSTNQSLRGENQYNKTRLQNANPIHRLVSRRGGLVKLWLCSVLFLFVFVVQSATATAQWLNYPAPGVPRLPDGKPNLSAPAPRSPDGKPDLDGIWLNEDGPLNELGVRTARGTFEI